MPAENTRRIPGRVPDLQKEWLEACPELEKYLTALAQIIADTAETAGDEGAAIAFFMGGQFAGASGGWGGAGAPITSEYIVKAVDPTLVNERVLTDTATVTWDYSVAAQAKANVPDDGITNGKLANMDESTIKGRAAGAGTGDPTDLTATQATAILNGMTGDSGAGGVKGLVPAPAAGDAAAAKFLKADATWAAVAPADATYLTLGTNSILTNERVLTPDDSTIAGTDAGAGSTYTLKAKNTLRGSKAITNGVHTQLFDVAVPSGGYTGGRVLMVTTITDGTDFECYSDIATYAAVNKGGTMTVLETSTGGASSVASTGGGMAVTLTALAGTNKIIVRIRATSSLATPTVLTCYWEAHDETGNTIAAL